MKLTWIKGLNKQDKEEMKLLFQSNARFREIASAIMQEKIASARKANVVESAYDNPNWALKQADAIGYERAMQEIISLFES